MSKGKLIPQGDALDLVQPVLDMLGPSARIAGSLRRGKDMVRDVDVVFQGHFDDELIQAIKDEANVVQGGERKIRLVVPVPGMEGEEIPGLQVDVVACEPDEFGACLLYLTGPHEYNIEMRAHAKAMGLKLNERGLWRDEERIAGATEKDIFDALGLHFTTPPGRTHLKTFAGQVRWSTVILGSKGDRYEVALRGDGSWHCPCRGFSFRRKCRHIDEAKNTKQHEDAA
jgi:DNA polymerase/3'-5' exonuclease PolX